MSSKYGFLSFLALGVLLLLIFKNYEVWTRPIRLVPETNVGKGSQSRSQNKPDVPSSMGSQKDSASVKSNVSIAAKNIFSPERKDFPILMGDGRKELVRPQIVLYGVTIAGDYRAASIATPGRPLQKGERETFTVRAGERVGDYKLAKVLSDRITLEIQGDTFEVLLYDSKTPKRRTDVRTEGRPATVTSTQPIPVSPPSSTPVPGSTPAVTGMPMPIPPAVQGRVTTPPPAPVNPSAPFPSRRGRTPSYSPPSGNPASPDVPPASSLQETGGN
ncbi:MAG TPA: hypothetical protein VEK32_01310 [Thermodesulfobacteriota bacterium]|nr:hypothetical protein [Thermodesulfobacteriota bacterium]